MRDDQRRLGVALDEVPQPGRDRRQSPAAVDEDRDAPLGGEREDGSEALVRRGEALSPRVQLDAACPGVEAASRFLERRFVQVESNERDQPPAAARRRGERAAVRGAERRMAVGFVETEDEGARDAVAGHDLLEGVVVADHAVDVVAEVRVDVEDVDPRRQQAPQLLVPALHELERPRPFLHGLESRYGPNP